jgi:flagellar hook-basal body complex protein FliE
MPVQFDSAPSLIPSQGLKGVSAATSIAGATSITGAGSGGFGSTLEKMLQSVDAAAGTANTAVADMVEGKGDVHDAMIALNRAETTLQLTVQVRNKLVQAYQEIMRMPV